jgi:hypothetical protein
MRPWNHWFHCTCNTFGTWLPGDPRGWRERHHRQHVNGDYRSPPPKGSGDRLHARSKGLMPRRPIHLDKRQRAAALQAVVGHLLDDRIEVLVAAMDDHHLHLLGQFSDHHPRIRLGWAKLAATKCLKADGGLSNLPPGVGIWAKRSKAIPIKDRPHLVNAVNYIAGHERRGAEVYLHPKLAEVRKQKMHKS